MGEGERGGDPGGPSRPEIEVFQFLSEAVSLRRAQNSESDTI